MVTAVKHLGDLIDPFGARGGEAGSRAEVDVPEPRGDLVDGDAGLEQVGGPVGPECVWVREPLGYAGGPARAPDEAVHRDGGEGERILIAVAAEAHKQRLLVEQPDTPRERMDCRPRLERLRTASGTGTSRSRPPFPRT